MMRSERWAPWVYADMLYLRALGITEQLCETSAIFEWRCASNCRVLTSLDKVLLVRYILTKLKASAPWLSWTSDIQLWFRPIYTSPRIPQTLYSRWLSFHLAGPSWWSLSHSSNAFRILDWIARFARFVSLFDPQSNTRNQKEKETTTLQPLSVMPFMRGLLRFVWKHFHWGQLEFLVADSRVYAQFWGFWIESVMASVAGVIYTSSLFSIASAAWPLLIVPGLRNSTLFCRYLITATIDLI